MNKRINALAVAAVIAVAATAATITPTLADDPDAGVKFHFLNVNSITREDTGGPVGSADCIVIEDHGIISMVDTGTQYKNSTGKIIKYCKDLGITRIDNLFLTHPHNDHVGGAPDIVEAFDITRAFYLIPTDWSKVRPIELDWRTKHYCDLAVTAIKEKINSDGTAVQTVCPEKEGEVYRISEDSYFTVYNCLAVNVNNFREPEFNDFSMMMKYTYKNVNGLFTGDINIQYEYVFTGEVNEKGERVAKGSADAIAPVGEIQIFKLPHHGTQGSLSTDAFFDLINPENKPYYAVVTGYRSNVGRDTVSRSNRHGYQVKITHDGNIVIRTDGTNLSWNQTPYNP